MPLTRCIISTLFCTALMVGQTFELKNGECTSLLTISDVKMFRYSGYFGQDIPEFQANVRNISGEDLNVGMITATIYRKNGTKAEFSFAICPKAICGIAKGATITATQTTFSPVLLFNREDYEFGGVEFTLADSMQCSEVVRSSAELKERRERLAAEKAEEERRIAEGNRINAEAEAKADVARRKRIAAEQKRKDDERDARLARIRAEENARAAEENRKIRANCTVIYQSTIDKKVKDLTVREEQQVRACQVLGLYPPT